MDALVPLPIELILFGRRYDRMYRKTEKMALDLANANCTL